MPIASRRSSEKIRRPVPRREMEDEFRHHVAKWVSDTAHVSSISKQVMHPSYQRIIGMGPEALPLLLRELEQRPRFWFWALTAIAGEDIVPDADAGNIPAMRDAWLRWGHARGLI